MSDTNTKLSHDHHPRRSLRLYEFQKSEKPRRYVLQTLRTDCGHRTGDERPLSIPSRYEVQFRLDHGDVSPHEKWRIATFRLSLAQIVIDVHPICNLRTPLMLQMGFSYVFLNCSLILNIDFLYILW